MIGYLKSRWRGLTKFTLWTFTNLVIVPRFPCWLQLAFYGAVLVYLGYTTGVIIERKRRIQDAIRFGDDLVRMRDDFDELKAGLRGGVDEVERAFNALWKKANPVKPEELN